MLPGRWRWLGIAAWAASLVAAPALADGLDPSRPIALEVGPPRGHAPSARLDARRSGRTRARLPDKPTETWRRQLGPFDLPPLVDAEGAILALLTTPEVIKLSPDGRELWRQRIGASPAVVPAVLTSDGILVVVTGSGHAVGLTPAARVAFDVPLDLRVTDKDSAPLALDDGGVVIAAGSSLVALGRDGAVRARAVAPARIAGALVGASDGVLFTTEDGTLYAWRAPSQPRRIASFGGSVEQGVVLLTPRTVVAVVDRRRVVAVDSLLGARHVWANLGSTADTFDGPPAADGTTQVVTATASGSLVFIDAAAGLRPEALLEKRLLPGTSGGGPAIVGVFAAGVALKPSPAVIVDPQGRVAFVRAHGRTGIVLPDRSVVIASERACGAPLAVLPAGERAMLVACHDGTVVAFSDESPLHPR